MSLRIRLLTACFMMTALAGCRGDATAPQAVTPPEVPQPPAPVPPVAQRIEINVDSKLVVGGEYTAAATVIATSGAVLDEAVTFESSDSTVARVISAGSQSARIVALKLGKVAITARTATLSAKTEVEATAWKIVLDAVPFTELGIGQSVQLSAHLIDLNGKTLGGQESLGWTTDVSSGVAVSPNGLVTGLPTARQLDPVVYAMGGGVKLTLRMTVYPIQAGLPAYTHLVHAAPGLAPITFTLSNGRVEKLAYGESADVPAKSGGFAADVTGLPNLALIPPQSHVKGMLAPSEGVTIYVAGGSHGADLYSVISSHAAITPGTALLRVIMAGGIPSYYGVNMTVAGAPIAYCYDDYTPTEYFPVQAPAVDIGVFNPSIFGCNTGADSGTEVAKFPVQPAPGHAMTYVITGVPGDRASYRIFTFTDD